MKNRGAIVCSLVLFPCLFGAAAALAAGAQRHAAPPGTIPITTDTPVFDPYVAYPVGSWPTSVAIADVTHDGLNDVLLTTEYYFDPDNDFKLFMFRQYPDGYLSLTPKKVATDGAYSDSMRLATGNLVGDDWIETLVTTSAGIDGYAHAPQGHLRKALLVTSSEAVQAEIADIDRDGDLDIVANSPGGVLLLTNGGNRFKESTITTILLSEIKVGDVSGDDLPDLVGFTGHDVYVFPQRLDGSFSGPVVYEAVIGYWPLAEGLDVGDVTGDGLADVVVTIGGNRPGSLINVFRQKPDGTLADPAVYSSYDIPEPVVVADVDGDGRGDVVVAHGGWNQAGVYYQLPDGTLGAENLYPIPYASHYDIKGLAVGDFSGDGRADIAIADYNNGLVVLRQTAP